MQVFLNLIPRIFPPRTIRIATVSTIAALQTTVRVGIPPLSQRVLDHREGKKTLVVVAEEDVPRVCHIEHTPQRIPGPTLTTPIRALSLVGDQAGLAA
jgi:hypothetical protein